MTKKLEKFSMAKMARLFSLLVVLALAGGTIACQNQTISTDAATTSTQNVSSGNNPETKRANQKTEIAVFDRAIELNPNDLKAYNDRGLAHFALGDRILQSTDDRQLVMEDLNHLHAAVADFNRAIELKPDYAELYNNRGLVRSALGDRQLRPLYESDTFEKDIDYREAAVADFNRAIELKPDYAEAYKNRGTTYIDLGNLEAASTDLDRAIELKPDYAEAYIDRGNLRYALNPVGKKQTALADYRKAVELYRQQGNPQPWLEETLQRFEEQER